MHILDQQVADHELEQTDGKLKRTGERLQSNRQTDASKHIISPLRGR